jgi:hypothetical protein
MTSSSSCGWCLTVPSLYRIGNHAEAEEHRQWHEEPAGGTRGGGGRSARADKFNVQPSTRNARPPAVCATTALFDQLRRKRERIAFFCAK